MAQDRWRKLKFGRQRMVMGRSVIDMLRTLHGAYAPENEPFGARIKTFFICICVLIGEIEGKPFTVTKLAHYMLEPRATVMRRLERLQRWKLVKRRGRYYHSNEKTFNSVLGLSSYRKVRRILSETAQELSILDTQAGNFLTQVKVPFRAFRSTC